jgi:GTP-binding protein
VSLPVVALVGRPNVGKSQLFNRIVGGSAAIVSDQAGTTRDRHFAAADWAGRHFWLVDTGGLVDDPSIPMDLEIRRQVEMAIAEADLLLFVVDAQVGVHPTDRRLADLIREAGKPWLLIVNKVDDAADPSYYEFYELGAGDPVPVAARSGIGSGDMLDALVAAIPEMPEEAHEALRVAVIGRPNVGKSSFINRLLGEERLVVADEAGTTRDAIDTPVRYHDRDLVFVDTAGLRRQSRVDDGIEFYATLRTRRAIERAQVCVLVIDAVDGLHNQDLKIANLAWEEGRGLVLVVNKWDAFPEKTDKSADKFRKDAIKKAPFLKHVPFLFTSALTGMRVQKVLDTVLAVDEARRTRVPTSAINECLGELLQRRQPPQAAGREVKLNYATQVEIEPPTIAVFGNHPETIPESYVRFLHNGFRLAYPFTGAPLRIVLRRKHAER